jgi:hypothetical protein
MAAASMLLDAEFQQFVQYAIAHGVSGATFRDSMREVASVSFPHVDFDSNWGRDRKDTGPIYLRLEVGSWAQKLQQVGLVIQVSSEEEFDYREDAERHVDEPGSIRRLYRSIELREGVSHLVRLTQIAIRAKDAAPTGTAGR